MDAAYGEVYPELYRAHWWWRARERFLVREIEAVLATRRTSAILDVGCGSGLFFAALERFGSVEGIESDARAVAQSGRWRERIHVGHLDDSWRASRSYDLVLFLDVLEHVEHPADLLRRAGGLLRPGGHVLMTVPAFQWLWTRHDDMNHHLRRYTSAGLEADVRAAGLHPVRRRYLFPSLVLAKLAVRLKEKLVADRPAVPRVPPKLLNRLLESWLRLEFMIARWTPIGSSMMMVAKQAQDAGRS